MNYGYIKVAAAVPLVKVADCNYNVAQMLPIIKDAAQKNVEILLFPELGITSYSCSDLFRQQSLLREAEKALGDLLLETSGYDTIIIAGMPIAYNGRVMNCAVIMHKGKIAGIVPKRHIQEASKHTYERCFASGTEIPEEATIHLCNQVIEIHRHTTFRTSEYTFAIEIGEEAYLYDKAPQSAEIILNPSAVIEIAGKRHKQIQSYTEYSRENITGYIHAGCGFGESTGDNVFAGNAMILENGKLLTQNRQFCLTSQTIISEIDIEQLRNRRIKSTHAADSTANITTTTIEQQKTEETTITRTIDAHPFIPSKENMSKYCSEIFSIQAIGLAKRIMHTNAKSCIIGISGGLDSTLALLVTVKAYDILQKERKEIIGVTMPGFGTTDRTYLNALELMKRLNITTREIPIREACTQHFNDIGHDINKHDVTYENSQARERTQILMDIANQTNGMVIGTGDLSELALGWATYNGDHMSMYGVNASIPKTLVQHMVRWVASDIQDTETGKILYDIVDTPISPELIPAHENGDIKQKTEDLVGPYELHDFFLYNFINNGYTPRKIHFIAQKAFAGEYDSNTIKKWLTTFFRRFFTQQFKRSCMPDGPQATGCSLSPRGSWQMPSDASYSAWIKECEML